MTHATQQPKETGGAVHESILEALRSLPAESSKDFCELSELFAQATDQAERDEISKAMAEILFPELTKVSVTEVTLEDSQDVRQKVDRWYSNVGKQIKFLRNQRHWTQEKLARKAGIPQSHVSRLERGKHAPSYVTIKKIAMALGLRPGDIDPGCEP